MGRCFFLELRKLSILIDPGSVVTTSLNMLYKDKKLSIGTGFFIEQNEQKYLITNWHNVTGKNPLTKKNISSTLAVPDRLSFQLLQRGKLDRWVNCTLLLYSDADDNEQPKKPVWLEHPNYGNDVDVVAIKISDHANTDIHTVDEINKTPEMKITVTQDVFVLGYPKGISGSGNFPIWKRASIATEPGINRDGLPKMLIDTATREGMSGSPVVALSRGSHVNKNGAQVIGQDGSRFIGVYSGRLGDGEGQAQLGIVWKASSVEEIISHGVRGTGSF